MLIAIIPLLAAIAGILIFALSSNAKMVEVGKALMWCGILVTLFVVANHTIKVF